MRIVKIYNNNVVSAVDTNDLEAVLTGSGIGFSRKSGDEVDMSRVEKRFVLDAGEASQVAPVLAELPPEILELLEGVTRMLLKEHRLALPSGSEIALADHLRGALDRLSRGDDVRNPMLWEIRTSYPDEFRIALDVLAAVENLADERLPLDEAGFITLHLVNSGAVSGVSRTTQIAATLRNVELLVHQELGIVPDHNDVAQIRFLTHLKFVLQRLTDNTSFAGSFQDMFAKQAAHDPEGHRCALLIGELLSEQHDTQLSDEETFYLMIHLDRLRRNHSTDTRDTR